MKMKRLVLMLAIALLIAVFAVNSGFVATQKSESIHSHKISKYISEDYHETKISKI